jgi:threonine/homoserine/homoserine lactone efflux protein
MATRAKGAAQANPQAAPPAALRLAAAAQVIEAAGLCVAAAFGAVSTADGKSSQAASGVALTVFAVLVAVGIALIAAALAKARPWSRTPTVMTQLLVVIGGIVLLDGHRPEWGVPALLLAAACLAGLLTPASLRALNRPPVNR